LETRRVPSFSAEYPPVPGARASVARERRGEYQAAAVDREHAAEHPTLLDGRL